MKTRLNVAGSTGATGPVLSLVASIGGQGADNRRAAQSEVEALRESCMHTHAIEHALFVLAACPAEAFREPELFSADRTEDDEIVLDWDADDGGPSVTLFVAPSGNTVYVCQWDGSRRVTGNDGHDSEYLRETLGGAFRRLSKERRHAENRSRLVG